MIVRRWRRIVEPRDIAFDVNELKRWLRIFKTDNTHDVDVSELGWAAGDYMERRANLSLMPQRWELSIDMGIGGHLVSEPCTILGSQGVLGPKLRLSKPPIQTVDSFTYYSPDDASHTLVVGTDFLFDPSGKCLFLPAGKQWPTDFRSTRSIVIEITTGYATADAIPFTARLAAKLVITHWNENRSALVTGTISKEAEIGFLDLLGPLADLEI